jgi:mannose/fructose/N-acetylgalactosamine-specific phosphotransferase system component IIC
MRGCITLLTFVAMLSLPFVVLGYSLAAFIVMAVIFIALWGLTRALEAFGEAYGTHEEGEEEDEQ